MLTLPLLQRLWQTARYRQLIRQVLSGRPEAVAGLDERIGGPLAAAAVGLLRLAELSQTTLPAAREMLIRLLMSQNRDGSWGEASADRPILTALCVRALCGFQASGSAIRFHLGMPTEVVDRPRGAAGVSRAMQAGIAWLSGAQDAAGGWGGEDPVVTPIVLLQLGRLGDFRRAVQLHRALAIGRDIDPGAEGGVVRRLWNGVHQRCGPSLRLVSSAQAAAEARRRTASRSFDFAEVA